jgi:aspartate-semialdehyde dehydrogenase
LLLQTHPLITKKLKSYWMKVAIVGSTGLVGRTLLEVIKGRSFPFDELMMVASSRSAGRSMEFLGKEYVIIEPEEALRRKPDIAIFSAGSSASLQWAPLFAKQGCRVIDNSSAWRMHDDIPLIVPEVNGFVLKSKHRIISNPNCSTIQLVMVLSPLHQRYRIRRIVISTYQSVTGTGMAAVKQLEAERQGFDAEMIYPHQIHNNIIPQGGDFNPDAYTKEEEKLIRETRKILGDESILVSPTVVRVPVTGGHSESVNIEFYDEPEVGEVYRLLQAMPGLTVQDNPSKNLYPMPLTATGKDEVFVGRVRKDPSEPKALNLWISADNLRKGAATNAVQIAEYLIANRLLGS